MGKSTISMVTFHSYVKLPEGNWLNWAMRWPMVQWVPLSGRGLQIIVPYPKRGAVRRPNPAAGSTGTVVVAISVEKPATTHQSSTIDYIYIIMYVVIYIIYIRYRWSQVGTGIFSQFSQFSQFSHGISTSSHLRLATKDATCVGQAAQGQKCSQDLARYDSLKVVQWEIPKKWGNHLVKMHMMLIEDFPSS